MTEFQVYIASNAAPEKSNVKLKNVILIIDFGD